MNLIKFSTNEGLLTHAVIIPKKKKLHLYKGCGQLNWIMNVRSNVFVDFRCQTLGIYCRFIEQSDQNFDLVWPSVYVNLIFYIRILCSLRNWLHNRSKLPQNFIFTSTLGRQSNSYNAWPIDHIWTFVKELKSR